MFKWEVKPSDTFPAGYRNYTEALFLTGRRVAEARKDEMVQWGRVNAPWQDVTGAARRGIDGEVGQSPGVLAEIVIHHDPSLPYTLWLEIGNAGKYSIITKIIDAYAPVVWRDMQRIINLQLATKG